MIRVLEPTVGPIVGATQTASVRIFLRGKVELSGSLPRRSHGVLRLKKTGDAEMGKPRYFKLNPNFDFTGVVVVDGLEAETAYTYQAGCVFSDLDSDDLDITTLEWVDVNEHTFTTASEVATRERSFVFGSCRYLLRLFGGTLFDNRGDKTFGSILKQITEAKRRTDALIMVGDQIYADDLNFLKADSTVDQFYERYRDAFTTSQLRQLMSCVPTYMTLDDHEIEDNWPARANRIDYVRKFPAAMHAYLTYQLSHSPLFQVKDGRVSGTPNALWYTFRDGCADFFMADTRTERVLDSDRRQVIGDAQFDALKAWLNDGSGRVKFIASGVPPFAASGDDKWEGFVDQRDALFDFIAENRIRRVVFLSGDVHASFAAALGCDADPSFQIVSVVSSAFFWPYPHPARGSFQADGLIKSNSRNGYRLTTRTPVALEDNFTRVSCTTDALEVEVFARKGDSLSTTRFPL